MSTLQSIARRVQAQTNVVAPETEVQAAGAAVTNDSRRVVPGGIFVAIKGAHHDGNNFIAEAMKRLYLWISPACGCRCRMRGLHWLWRLPKFMAIHLVA
jgi:UDP-N-acetylmuramyl pentapeptide synthase